MNAPLVSIITVNYDHPEVTCSLLESLRRVSYQNLEILVVDNASPKDDPSVIPQRHPEVTFIQSESNLGFAGGNNLAVRQSKGKYLLFLNNDTEVDPGFLEPLFAKGETDANMGGVSPKSVTSSVRTPCSIPGRETSTPIRCGTSDMDGDKRTKVSLIKILLPSTCMVPP